jgi:cytochrome b involved in lipid metabolism
MKTQTILFITGIALVVVLAAVFMSRPEGKTTPTAVSGTNEQTVQIHTENAGGMTRAEVSSHASRQDCYTIINDKVYNVTSWIDKHPGGAEAILSLCGKDGTVPFMQQHGSTPKAQATLAAFFIANLIN